MILELFTQEEREKEGFAKWEFPFIMCDTEDEVMTVKAQRNWNGSIKVKEGKTIILLQNQEAKK